VALFTLSLAVAKPLALITTGSHPVRRGPFYLNGLLKYSSKVVEPPAIRNGAAVSVGSQAKRADEQWEAGGDATPSLRKVLKVRERERRLRCGSQAARCSSRRSQVDAIAAALWPSMTQDQWHLVKARPEPDFSC
jgi:hypothetical protein